MFSQNGKISEKQMGRMMILPVFASGIFVIPYLSARLFGASILPGLGIFFAVVCLYGVFIYAMGALLQGREGENGKNGLLEVLTTAGLPGKLLLVVQVVRLFIRLVFYLLLTMAILKEGQVPFMPETSEGGWENVVVVLPLLLVAVYGANRDVEKQARIHEMLFWTMFIPFIIIMLFGLREVDYSIFVPHFKQSVFKMLRYSWVLLVFLLPMENYLYLKPDLRGRHGKLKNVLLAVLVMIVLALFIIGIYGLNGAGNERMLTIAIMRYIRLPFGVLERFDVLMLWFFATGCFILICNTLYYIGRLLGLLCGFVKRIWKLLLVALVAVVVLIWLPDYGNNLWLYICYGISADIPLSVVVPLLAISLKKWQEACDE